MAKTSKLKLNSKIRVKEPIVSRTIQDEEMILDIKTGTYFGLNEAGTDFWRELRKSSSLQKALQAVALKYDLDPESVEKDFIPLLESLKKS